MTIETVTTATFDQVLPLIAAYQRFYGAQPDDARNRQHFAQFLDDHSAGILFIALDDTQQALGFATIYFPFSSVRATPLCLMNDLYTVESARGQGIGRALIVHCQTYAREHGFDALFWNTQQENLVAQKLYNSTGASRTAWFEYVLPTA